MVSQADPDGPRSDLSSLTDSLARIPDAQRRAIVLRDPMGFTDRMVAAVNAALERWARADFLDLAGYRRRDPTARRQQRRDAAKTKPYRPPGRT